MNNFDSLFFRAYIGADQEIKKVFHRHFFVIVEDVLLWTFFGLMIPGFLYGNDLFSLRTSLGTEMYAYIYMMLIYGLLMYKIFDWYVDVWIATENTIVDMSWRWFSSDLLYIPYEKIEGVEIRTRSWWAALLGMSDVVVKLAG
jgi:Bacterial PH domain